MRDISNGGFIALVAVALFVLMLVFLWAAAPQLTEGVVVDKTFHPAYDRLDTTGTGDSRRVKVYHHSARWEIRVSGTTEEGEARAEWWEVGEAMYGRIEIGDRVQRDPQTGVVSIVGGKK